MYSVTSKPSAGVDVSSGQPPSAMTMFKLAADKEFRDVAKNVSEELKNAGIDVTNKVGTPTATIC